jgi:hypothetical protein
MWIKEHWLDAAIVTGMVLAALMAASLVMAQDSAVVSTMLSPAVYQPGEHRPGAAVPKPEAANAVRVVLDRTKLTDPAQRMSLRLFYTDGVNEVSIGAVTIGGGVFLRNGQVVTASSMSPSIGNVPPGAQFFTTLTVLPGTPPAETAVVLQFREVK